MLMEALLETARRRGDVLAVADETARLTYRQVLRLAQIMRGEVADRTQAKRVGLLLPACSAFPGCLFGVLWAERTAVPLNFLLAPAELRRHVAAAGLDVILTVRHFRELAEQLPATPVFLEDLPIKRRMVGAMLRCTPDPPAVRPEDTAVVLFTSGTSAEPKGVELTQSNLASNCRDCIATARLAPDHRFLNCLPPFHVFGLTANVLAPVVVGATVFCIPRFQPTRVAATLKDERISIFMAIPSMHGALLRLKSAPSDMLASMFIAASGGEPLPEAIWKGYRERFGTTLVQGYGLTETSPVCTLELPDAYKPGSIGRPIQNVAIRTVDPEGADVPIGADGEIWVRGPNVMKGYLDRPDLTRAAVTPDGWFRTGDCGRIDVDGFATITGRLKEMMIVGGENVFPGEIESVLLQHPAVAEAAVIGAPDDSRGEVPIAFVTLKDGATATDTELRQFTRDYVAGFKVPRQVRIETDLPRNAIGKILKRKLGERL